MTAQIIAASFQFLLILLITVFAAASPKKSACILALTVVLSVAGCSAGNTHTSEQQTTSYKDKAAVEENTTEEDADSETQTVNDPRTALYQAVTETMPAEVVKEVEEHGVWHTVEGSEAYLLANSEDYEEVTLRLDFSYKDGDLFQYVSKDYGFVQDSVPEKTTTEDEAIQLVMTFADRFCGKDLKEADIKKLPTPVKWEGGEYAYYEDSDGSSYLIWMTKGMVTHYEAIPNE